MVGHSCRWDVGKAGYSIGLSSLNPECDDNSVHEKIWFSVDSGPEHMFSKNKYRKSYSFLTGKR